MNKKIYVFFIISLFLMLWTTGAGVGQQQYTLTVTKTGSGDGTVTSSPPGIKCGANCSTAYNQGKTVTLKAKPDSKSSFNGWSGGGCSGTKNCTVTMNANTTVIATFEKKEPKISISTDHLTFGTVEEGKKATQTITFSNIGTADLLMTFSVEGEFFSISGKSDVTIKPGRSYNLKVTFQPQSSSEGFDETEAIFPFEEETEEDMGSGQPTKHTGKIHCETNIPTAETIDLSGDSVPLVPLVNDQLEFNYDLLWEQGPNYEHCTLDGKVSLIQKGNSVKINEANNVMEGKIVGYTEIPDVNGIGWCKWQGDIVYFVNGKGKIQNNKLSLDLQEDGTVYLVYNCQTSKGEKYSYNGQGKFQPMTDHNLSFPGISWKHGSTGTQHWVVDNWDMLFTWTLTFH